MQRRKILAGMGAAVLAGGQARAAEKPRWLSPLLPDGTRDEATLEALPGKQKLIRLADRPPNYEAPIATFRTAITPSDQFFVRYHLAGIPSMVDLGNWSLNVGGDAADRQITLSRCRSGKELPARSKSLRCASVRATGAACRNRTSRAWNGATARWATRCGAGLG